MHLVSVSGSVADSTCRDTVGGSPFLPDVDALPCCRICGAPLVLFLQFDIRREFALPFREGSHLLAFMCPNHNEIPSVPSDYDDAPLPDRFWDTDDGHYSLLLLPPGQSQTTAPLDQHIAAFRLTFQESEEDVQSFDDFDVGSLDFKIGGVPGWMNYAINKTCPCGGQMAFICQTPDGFGFRKTESAPEQPDAFSATEYCLFLGNQVYILGCDRQCDPRALIAVCDN